MTSKEVESLLPSVFKIAVKAGKHLASCQNNLKKSDISSKKSQGIVSKADIESENMIVKDLFKLAPEIPVLAEESFYKKYKEDKSSYELFKENPYMWVIDPLDGTNNFVHGLEYFAVCISLVKKGKPILGVVHAPTKKETFLAVKGAGSFKIIGTNKYSDKNPIKGIRGKRNLHECFLATGFATEKGVVFDNEFKTFKDMMSHCRAIRRMGSAALDLCYTASGVYDGFWERGLAPWDLAAASVICTEAGVQVTEYEGQKLDVFSPTILAARKPTHSLIQNVILE